MRDCTVEQGISPPGYGKVVADHTYLHVEAIGLLSAGWSDLIHRAALISKTLPITDFQVVKLRSDGKELSLLDYPAFFDHAFPSLARSWRIRLETDSVVFRTYAESVNPPILHRKELLLPSDHPAVSSFQELTNAAEMLGLFEDSSRIGLREHWHQLISQRGYEIDGHQLVPIANEIPTGSADLQSASGIHRHLTALSRSNFSAPVQALWRHGLIDSTRTVFDYGCGRGDDLRGLLANGIIATGWDPHFSPDSVKGIADTVNLGFVINVIEDLAERTEALDGAFALTSGVLAVAAMLTSESRSEGRAHLDGYLTSRNTFQKYYSQLQLRDFIEHTLDEPAIAVGPGVFFVFKDKTLEQTFLRSRYGRQAKTALSRGWVFQRIQRDSIQEARSRLRTPKVDRQTLLFETHRPAILSLWQRRLELGRPPRTSELEPSLVQELSSGLGSLARAMRLADTRFDPLDAQRSTDQKRCDLLVFSALQQFQKRRPYRQLEDRLQWDIKHFFGDYSSLQAAARHKLFEIGQTDRIDAACRDASEKGLGWFEDSHSLQFHVSLLDRLPAILRIYVGCATILAGDTNEFDLVKVHVRSGKVTLMKFDDFDNLALPRLQQRIKVRLRDLDLDIFDYGPSFSPPLLYYKSRYINEEYPGYAEQVAFEEQLDRLELVSLEGFGPSAEVFFQSLEAARWEVNGRYLIRSTTLPDLDARCGAYLTYRQLIECGPTQQSTRLSNLPVQPETYSAYHELAVQILDPVIAYFGIIELTYGFCSPALAKEIRQGIAPHLDQHAGHERNRRGNPICDRLGAACDFLVKDEDMEEVAIWTMSNAPVDRLYFYGKDRPIHISWSNTPAGQFIRFLDSPSGKRIPKTDRKNSK